MSKKFVCSVIRIATMAISLVMLDQLYDIGLPGYVAVGVTGFVWAVTASSENDRT